MLPDKEVNVSVSADGFEEASRTLSLPEGKTEEVTFVLEPKAPKGRADEMRRRGSRPYRRPGGRRSTGEGKKGGE